MSDPAVEAAQQAWSNTIRQGGRSPNENSWAQSKAAAREALKPIRGVHEAWARRYANRFDGDALVVKTLLEDLAPLIYSTEELDEPDPAHSPIRKTFRS